MRRNELGAAEGMNASALALQGIEVLERGWLSSNNVLIGDDAEATLVDSGYATHAVQTESLVRHALRGRRLTRLGLCKHRRRAHHERCRHGNGETSHYN